MSLVLFNDLTRKKEKFIPIKEGHVSFYSCGPTVYDYFHVGNARPFIVFDVLRRWLEHSGYKVTFVQNFTDIDDKMIHRAHKENITVKELAEKFISEYNKDAEALGIRKPDVSPRATEHIPEIINTIEKIIANGHAYVSEGDVYFDIQSWPKYGSLCKQNLEDLEAGARVDPTEKKKDPLDFALWKAEKPGEPSWESPWGKGRPGWHIECSAMSSKYLGENIDIHSGGVDLMFPHHENEAAQSEAASNNGKPFVNYWLHNGFLLIDSEKMSKSLGNFLTARAAIEKYPPLALRFFMLSAHYRSPINFTPEGLEQAAAGVMRLRNCKIDLDFASHTRKNNKSDFDINKFESELNELDKKFAEAMDDDFNTAAAMGILFDVVYLINTSLKEHEFLPEEFFESSLKALNTYDEILGVIGSDDSESENDDESKEIEKLISERTEARKNKNFARSDEIRNLLKARGIVLEDTPQGTKWKREL
ncbi:MAG: cysteine--tRNA ligase [Synergistaceae bacterium]|nr:cysteine--tRNA ligase [Synergistaceae bacterium]MBR0081036.1 cysteine--tRNA ligase [Synergistaceae bacterium]MBR0252391.1 cysteine--tRNA ligase [Synergistaceae bacterium]MBR0317470.1 cysteine--tRNA ligase [Synergistaceae bacterium]